MAIRSNATLIAGAAAAMVSVLVAAAFNRRRRRQANQPWIDALRDLVEARPPTRRVDMPVEIMPHLLLGDQRTAADRALLEAFGVTHVLNAAGSIAASPILEAAGIEGLTLHGEDEEGYPMLARHFAEASAFIRKAAAGGGRCLVHCQAGINRSGVLVTAELMVHERLDVIEAVRALSVALPLEEDDRCCAWTAAHLHASQILPCAGPTRAEGAQGVFVERVLPRAARETCEVREPSWRPAAAKRSRNCAANGTQKACKRRAV